MPLAISGTSITFPDASTQTTSPFPGGFAFRNRIINGAMVIDQRNAGASVTTPTSYTLDRWAFSKNGSMTNTCQQSSTAPAGFSNSLLFTTTNAATIGATDYLMVYQQVEGYNIADLNWGTSDAATVTLSFYVRSSVTGTFGVTVRGGSGPSCWVASYTINSANTFERKTLTIPGPTSDTWQKTTSAGFLVGFDLGVGTTYSASATGAWQTGNYFGLTGGTKLSTTNGATFYVTGVQVEKGSTATSFDYRPYGTELALCQRYYNKSYSTGVVPGTATTDGEVMSVSVGGAGVLNFTFPVSMRATPTMTYYGPRSGGSGVFNTGQSSSTAALSQSFPGTSGSVGNAPVGGASYVEGHYTASAEL